jgi:hypothetical protein
MVLAKKKVDTGWRLLAEFEEHRSERAPEYEGMSQPDIYISIWTSINKATAEVGRLERQLQIPSGGAGGAGSSRDTADSSTVRTERK